MLDSLHAVLAIVRLQFSPEYNRECNTRESAYLNHARGKPGLYAQLADTVSFIFVLRCSANTNL